MRNLVHAIALLLVLGLSAPVLAGPFEDGVAAYDKGDYATAMRLWRLLADQGFANAQIGLGIMYDNGQGVPQDYAVAVKWYRLAADQGYAGAQNNLGVRYDEGLGVPQDYATAVKWYRLAADRGDANAQKNLGAMYEKGKGVPQDYVQAHKRYNLGAAAGNKDAIENRDIVAGKMTPAQIAEAQKLAAPVVAQTTETVGKLMQIERGDGQIVLVHEPIQNLNMGGRTTAFRVADFEILKGVQLGDFVKFEADRIDGNLTVIKIEKTDETDIHLH